MMEIKFRAWDKQRNEFLSGGEVFIAIQPGKRPKNIFYLDIITDPDKYKDRFVLQQYTGLIDKNGKEIYEGDIVRRTCVMIGDKYDGFLGTVKFVCAAFVIENEKDGINLWDDVQELEVLGNIYEKPELLECDSP
jgi:uncharacterized phage protein (TIGR01671 family)